MASIVSAGTTSATALNMSADTSGVLQLASNNGIVAVTVDAAQNVGIGVTPSAWGSNYKALESAGASAAVFAGANVNGVSLVSNAYATNASGYLYKTTGAAAYYSVNLSQHQWFTAPSGTAGNAISFTQAMTLFSTGGLSLGNTSDPGAKNLYVDGNIQGNGGNHQFNAATGSTNVSLYAQNAAGANAILDFVCPGSNSGRIYYERSTSRLYAYSQSNGVYLAATATSWTANSDERAKDIIEPITDAANKVSTLRAVIGKYKKDKEGTRRSFLIAQDVQAVLPEAVDASNPDDLGVQYSDVIPLLVAAIKEQQAMIESLTTRLAALEGAK